MFIYIQIAFMYIYIYIVYILDTIYDNLNNDVASIKV